MEPPRPDTPGTQPGSGENRLAPARPDMASPWPVDSRGAAARKRAPRFLAAFVVLTLALSAIGAGFVVVDGSLLPHGDADDYAFMATRSDGTPVRWNPCEPIHYVINLTGAPDGSMDDVHEAARRISAVTGVELVFDGFTSEIPWSGRGPYMGSWYHDRWAPVLVAWVDPDESDIRFDTGRRRAAAMARVMPAGLLGDVWVSGWIAMDRDDPNPPGWRAPGDQGPTLLHEFGHIMGLGHVKKPNELMHPAGGWMTDLGPGDREGLRQLGAEQGCLATPEPPS